VVRPSVTSELRVRVALTQLVPIEDLGEESEEVEDSEIEEGLAIEIAAMDPAPAYTE